MKGTKKAAIRIALLMTFGFVFIMTATTFVNMKLEANMQQKIYQGCEHWIVNYEIRGRVESEVMCGPDKLVRNGKYIDLPSTMVPMKEDIEEDYQRIVDAMYSVKESSNEESE